MNALLKFAAEYWWLIFIFGGIIGSLLEGVRDFILEALAIITGNRHHDQVTPPMTPRLQPPPPAAVAPPAEKKPGPCVHRNVSPIVSVTDEVVGWLCKTCTKRLPPDWAVREEDL